jgi:hypothetical protein
VAAPHKQAAHTTVLTDHRNTAKNACNAAAIHTRNSPATLMPHRSFRFAAIRARRSIFERQMTVVRTEFSFAATAIFHHFGKPSDTSGGTRTDNTLDEEASSEKRSQLLEASEPKRSI